MGNRRDLSPLRHTFLTGYGAIEILRERGVILSPEERMKYINVGIKCAECGLPEPECLRLYNVKPARFMYDRI